MKTTVLFTAAIFLATASFAQTNVKSNSAINSGSAIQSNKVTSNENVSSETNIESNAVTNVQQKSSAEIKQEQALATEKQSVAGKTNEKGKSISAIASDKNSVTVAKMVSSLASNGKSESADAHSSVSEQSNATVDTKTISDRVKDNGKKIRTASATTIQATTASVYAVKIKPVTVRTTTNAGVGLNIK